MRRSVSIRRALLAAAVSGLLLLSACGKDDPEAEADGGAPPEAYPVTGEETIPSLTQEIPPIDMGNVVYTPPASEEDADEEESDEEPEEGESSPEELSHTAPNEADLTGWTVYQYGGLTDSSALVSAYVSDLESDYGCAAVTDAGVRTLTPDLSQSEGEVLLAKNSEDQTGALFLRLKWEQNACTVATQFREGTAIADPEPLTLTDAIELIQSRTPASLGLPGSSMKDYYVWAEEGLVLVDGAQCIRVNAYLPPEYTLAGTFLVAANGEGIYRLDRATQEVTPLF